MRMLNIFCTLFSLFPALTLAETNACDEAARSASMQTDVPLEVLLSLTRTETGRKNKDTLMPWPWVVNMEGEGHWFANEEDARLFVFRHFKRGARSFDIGCFQINYKWHGQAFQSIEQMFDPAANALYAATFLEGLRKKNRTWDDAVGDFHSKTPKRAEEYRLRYKAVRAELRAITSPPVLSYQEFGNTSPSVWKPGPSERLGSLFDLSRNAAKPLFSDEGRS